MLFKKATLDGIIDPLNKITAKLQAFISDAQEEFRNNETEIANLKQRQLINQSEQDRAKAVVDNINGLLGIGKQG